MDGVRLSVIAVGIFVLVAWMASVALAAMNAEMMKMDATKIFTIMKCLIKFQSTNINFPLYAKPE